MIILSTLSIFNWSFCLLLKVLSIDFCAQFIDYCLKLQSQKTISYPQLEINFTLINNSSNILFKQLSWLPNEIPISDFILFTSIDTVEQPLGR